MDYLNRNCMSDGEYDHLDDEEVMELFDDIFGDEEEDDEDEDEDEEGDDDEEDDDNEYTNQLEDELLNLDTEMQAAREKLVILGKLVTGLERILDRIEKI